MAAIIFILIMTLDCGFGDVVSDYRKADKLWKVTRDNSPPSYFFATIHVPANLVWDSISDEAKKVFINSDAVYGEFDINYESYKDDKDKYSTLEDGVNIKDVISGGLYSRLFYIFSYPATNNLKYLLVREHPWFKTWFRMKPSVLSLNLSMMYGQVIANYPDETQECLPVVENIIDGWPSSTTRHNILDTYLEFAALNSGKIFGGVENYRDHFYKYINMSDHLAEYSLNIELRRWGFEDVFEPNSRIEAEVDIHQ